MRKIAVCAALLCCMAATFALTGRVEAAQIADSVAFQGRLLDAADQPVTGNLDVILSLWSDSTGGTQLWSHTQTVAIQKGLFSTCLGCGDASFFDVFNTGDLFLQTQLGGQPPMAPRTRIRNTPRAVMSSRVLGDISTAPGVVVVGDSLTGTYAKVHSGLAQAGSALASGAGAIRSSVGNNQASIAIDESGVHITQVATADSSTYDQGSDVFSAGKYFIHAIHNGSHVRVMHGVYPDSTVFDEGGDFGTAKVIHRDLATRNVLLSESRFDGSALHSSIREECDDGDASISAIGDLDRDGIPDVVVASTATGTTGRLAINTKGTGAKRLSAGGDCDDTDSKLHVDCDDDGDGIAESSVSQSSNSEGSSVRLNGIMNGMPNRISMNLTTARLTQTATISQGADLDGDGLDETSMSSSVKRKSGSIIYLDREGNEVLRSLVGVDSTRGVVSTDHDSDGDGVPEDEATMRVLPGTCSVAIKTKGTGADKDRVASSGTTTGMDSVACVTEVTDGTSTAISNMRTRINELEAILKNIGLLHSSVSGQSCTDTGAFTQNTVDADNDGTLDVECSSSASVGRSILKGYFQSGDIPSQEQFYTLLDKTGAHNGLQVSTSSKMSSATMSVWPDSIDRDITVDDGSGYSMKVKEKGNRTKYTSNLRVISPSNTTGRDDDCDGVSARTVWSQSGGGALNTLTIEAGDAIDPILHSSGAKLTAGGVWTNASDANLKENFQPVDGEEILNKVDALPITEWNYKTESEEEKHIGPTAQDFQQVFGVGSDGHSISTIDPSGIALAAIKELNKKVKEVDQLKSEVQELKALVQKLAAENARRNRGE